MGCATTDNWNCRICGQPAWDPVVVTLDGSGKEIGDYCDRCGKRLPDRKVADRPPYTLRETIADLDRWRRGGRMYPVEVGLSSLYWLEHSPDRPNGYEETIDELREWCSNDAPDIPEPLALDTLVALRALEGDGE